MKQISREEYSELQAFLEHHILKLWEHENASNHVQDYTQTAFPINQIFKYELNDEQLEIFIVYNTIFLSTIVNYIPKAITKSSQCFGTNNAWDVIEALYRESHYDFGTIENYADCLRDTPCYIVYKINGKFSSEILRLDLFRDIKENNHIIDFIGGLFHALKHFSMGGINLSIGRDRNEVFDVMHIVYLIALAFRLRKIDGNKYKAIQILKDKNKEYKVVYYFYKEVHTGFYFLITCHKKSF